MEPANVAYNRTQHVCSFITYNILTAIIAYLNESTKSTFMQKWSRGVSRLNRGLHRFR